MGIGQRPARGLAAQQGHFRQVVRFSPNLCRPTRECVGCNEAVEDGLVHLHVSHNVTDAIAFFVIDRRNSAHGALRLVAVLLVHHHDLGEGATRHVGAGGADDGLQALVVEPLEFRVGLAIVDGRIERHEQLHALNLDLLAVILHAVRCLAIHGLVLLAVKFLALAVGPGLAGIATPQKPRDIPGRILAPALALLVHLVAGEVGVHPAHRVRGQVGAVLDVPRSSNADLRAATAVLLAQRKPALGVGGHLFGWLKIDFHDVYDVKAVTSCPQMYLYPASVRCCRSVTALAK